MRSRASPCYRAEGPRSAVTVIPKKKFGESASSLSHFMFLNKLTLDNDSARWVYTKKRPRTS